MADQIYRHSLRNYKKAARTIVNLSYFLNTEVYVNHVTPTGGTVNDIYRYADSG